MELEIHSVNYILNQNDVQTYITRPSTNLARMSGERCKLPQWAPFGAKPRTGTHFYAVRAQKLHLMVMFLVIFATFSDFS